MTPKDARNSLCPMTFGPVYDAGADIIFPSGFCFADACMAWRWSEAKRTEAYIEAVHAHVVKHNVDFKVASQAVWKERGPSFQKAEGYCGLAGEER